MLTPVLTDPEELVADLAGTRLEGLPVRRAAGDTLIVDDLPPGDWLD